MPVCGNNVDVKLNQAQTHVHMDSFFYFPSFYSYNNDCFSSSFCSSFFLKYKTPVTSFIYSMHFTFIYTMNNEMKSVLLYANEIDGSTMCNKQQKVLTASLSKGYT